MSASATDIACYHVWLAGLDGSPFAIDPADARVVDRAMRDYAETKTDTWISVSEPSGGALNVLASRIVAAQMATPDVRRLATARTKALEDERKMFRLEAGYIGDED